jgi:hypothetical protein
MGVDPISIKTALVAAEQLPEPIKKSAIQAISRFLGSIGAIPDAIVRRIAQGLNDKTEAQAEIWKRVAVAAGDRIANDDELLDRATVSLLGEGYRKYLNKEAVARETIARLAEEPQQPEQTSVPAPDDDWLNVFSSHAENASSERLQQMWGRVLAGEIRKPGSFSLSTLRFVSELDRSVAETFQSIVPFIFAGNISKSSNPGEDLSQFLILEEAGLLSGTGGTLTLTLHIGTNRQGFVVGRRRALRFTAAEGTHISMPCMVLSKVGREILTLLPYVDEEPAARSLARRAQTAKVESIELMWITGRLGSAAVMDFPETIWPPPPDSPAP